MKNHGNTFINNNLHVTLCLYILCCFVVDYVYAQSDTVNTSTTCASSADTTISSITIEEQQGLRPDDKELMNMLNKQGLYYDLPSIMNDIHANQFKTGMVDLLSVYNRSQWISNMRKSYQAKDQIKKKKRKIFINIETVYSSKRDLLTKVVARLLRGKHMTCPPRFMADIRMILGHGQARKLYYSLTKYSTAGHIKNLYNTFAIVLEKYWLHHAAFIIGKCLNTADMPPRGHPIYKWPSDLMKPDVVFFVNATDKPGGITGFNQPFTPFTERLITVFRRVEGVKVVEINPNPRYQTIVTFIIDYIKEHFQDHPDITVSDLGTTNAIRLLKKIKR